MEYAAGKQINKAARGVLNNISWVILVFCIIIFSASINGFFSIQNYINIIHHSVFIGLLAIAESFCLISGKMDLSVESVAAFGAILSAWLCGTSTFASGYNINPFLGLLIVIVAGALIGLINAYIILKLNIDAFLVTLASYITVRGLATFVTQGKGVATLPDSFRWIDRVRPLNIPLVVFLMICCYILFGFILTRSRFGRHIFIIGGNINAAYNFGLNINSTIIKVFILSGAISGLTGWLIAARANGATPAIATGFLFEVLAAVVIGGVSLRGGSGNLVGVFAGVLILSAIKSALNILAISPFLTEIIRGLLVLLAIMIDSLKRMFR